MLKITKITVKRLKLAIVAPAIAMGVASCSSTPPANNTLIDRDDPKYSTIYDVFSRYDTNSDNYLDRHEFSQFQLDPEIIAFRERIPEAARTIPLLFEEIDEDSDERISLDEITVIAEGYIPKIE
jgi:Ca2+-binding EF-hand superfamily protein